MVSLTRVVVSSTTVGRMADARLLVDVSSYISLRDGDNVKMELPMETSSTTTTCLWGEIVMPE
jgi:hypothetical protein